MGGVLWEGTGEINSCDTSHLLPSLAHFFPPQLPKAVRCTPGMSAYLEMETGYEHQELESM